nr:MAG TPA: hypothetical protein [Bacteriophage sp.]
MTSTVVNTARSLGDVPTLIVLLVLVLAFLGWTIKQLVCIDKTLKESKTDQKKIDKEQDDKIQNLQQNCLKREEFYIELGGWRTELKDMEARLTKNSEMQMKNIELVLKNLKEK